MQLEQSHSTKSTTPFVVLTTSAAGEFPVLIRAADQIFELTADYQCPANDQYSLVEKAVTHTRFFNIYRAADGSFCFGSRSFLSNESRNATNDSQRAIAGVRIVFNENAGTFDISRV